MEITGRLKMIGYIQDVSPNSFEVAMSQKSSAELALQKAKQREKEIINNGGRFIKRGIRAYVLTK